MTLELKRRYQPYHLPDHEAPYRLGGVMSITNDTEYGEGHFAITIFDRRVLFTDCFEYVRDADTGKEYVRNGVWIG